LPDAQRDALLVVGLEASGSHARCADQHSLVAGIPRTRSAASPNLGSAPSRPGRRRPGATPLQH
jgi:hypothetical protein